jgi:hypothetical protein
MKIFIKTAILALFFTSTLSARPDVFFTDSDRLYNGAYLRHELDGPRIKFILTGPIANITMPDEFFNLADLERFLVDYRLRNQALKEEFSFMLGHSYFSQFKAVPFLSAWKKFLRVYKLRTYPPGE